MKAIIYTLRPNSLFSIRIPYTWQSALSYPLPPPSSIIGMLANALQRYKNNRDPRKQLDEVEQNIKWAGAKLSSPAIIKSYTTSAITKWEVNIGGKSTNALGRQYVFANKIQIVAVIENEEFAKELLNAIKNTPITCGDSESLVSVEETRLQNAESCKFQLNSQIETEYHIPMKFEEIELLDGVGRIYPMHERCRKIGKEFPLVNYILPLREENGILYPSKLKLKIKKELSGLEIEGIGKVIATN